MKKFISIALVIVLAISVIALVGCGNKPEANADADAPAATLKFGMGVTAKLGNAMDADGETDGSGEFNTTGVAVLLDAEGKIVAIDLDTAQIKTAWTSEGKLVATEDFRTKYEKGTDYNMAAFGKKHDGSEGTVLEWDKQADIFMEQAIGKTLDEVKAFAGEDMYAIGDLATAGCTINVADFIVALEKAVANAVDSDATAADKLNISLVSSASYSNKDADEDAEGLAQIDTTVVAAVVNAEGKVVVAKTDCTQGKMTFDTKGVVTADTTAAIKTKLELGNDYGMAAYGKKHDGSEGAAKEWFEQAAAFDAALVGKTAAEFAALAGEDSYATGDLATAGCTMAIGDMIAAAVKAATVA
ncbi:MAG: hypothetical protein IKV44_03475 [Clostridia bacterium]|nr:hypothetical protein [Clostridia bacterium]